MANKITNEDLHAARVEVERTRRLYDDAVEARDKLIRQAIKQGMRPAHVARHTGLTRQRIDQMRVKGEL